MGIFFAKIRGTKQVARYKISEARKLRAEN